VKGEELCRGYSEKYGIKYTIMRMSNVYGPGFQVKPNLSVVPLFVLRALSNQDLMIYGNGKQTRDFVHVKDIVQVYERTLDTPKAADQVFNLGSGNATSINELARTIAKAMGDLYGRKVNIKHIPLPEWRKEAKGKFDYSIQKAQKFLDYKPWYSLKSGIIEILQQ
jgi:UDP-glucose 4-epimerase